MNRAIEEAARHLSRWRGTGMAWHADVEWVSPEDPDNAVGDRLPVSWRGRLEDGAARSVAGSGQVRQERTWVRSTKAAVMPCHRSASDVSAALAMAKLDGPLEAILLLVCCEDLAQWPTVERYALACLRHPHAKEAAADAMHRILWRRPVMALHGRAKVLRTRRSEYAKVRHAAESMFRDWIAESSERFIGALLDGPGSNELLRPL